MKGQREKPIAKRIAYILINLCKEKRLIENTNYPLIGVQTVISGDQGKKVLVDLQIPNKSGFPIIGFYAHRGEMVYKWKEVKKKSLAIPARSDNPKFDHDVNHQKLETQF